MHLIGFERFRCFFFIHWRNKTVMLLLTNQSAKSQHCFFKPVNISSGLKCSYSHPLFQVSGDTITVELGLNLLTASLQVSPNVV